MKKILYLVLVLLLTSHCRHVKSSAPSSPPETINEPNGSEGERDELIELVYANFKASEEEDLEAAMRIMDEQSDTYASDKFFMQQLFSLYDLDYEIEAIEVTEKTESEAQIALTQLVKKISGAAFQDQRTNTVLHFRKIDGAWKIVKREVKKTTYLN